MNDFVYHGSKIKGLKVLKPTTAIHGKSWVYAARNQVVAALFLGEWNDFSISPDKNSVTNRLILAERCKNAFAKCFSGRAGSIYTVSAKGFMAGRTRWDEELVNPDEAAVIAETGLSDAWEFVMAQAAQNLVQLYYYPDRPASIPADDADLMEKLILTKAMHPDGATQGGELERYFLSLHPHLKSRLESFKQSADLNALKAKYLKNADC